MKRLPAPSHETAVAGSEFLGGEPICSPLTHCNRSSRTIDIRLSKTVFWDVRNRSTWHQDYPDMMLSQYIELVNIAKAQGEEFVHGEKTFETYVGSYRMSSSAKSRTQVRDGLKLTMALPSTSYSQYLPTTGLRSTRSKALRLILARFIATPQSVLPSLELNITEPFTSWGRGYANTIVYRDGYEDRVPKYAFKLVLWKQGLLASDTQIRQQDLSFWISTEATMGIKVNGLHIKSNQGNQPLTASREWGELRHGDKVTVWTKENRPSLYVRFRFECYFGASKSQRENDTTLFSILPKGKARDELDGYCLQKEHKLNARVRAKREKCKGRRSE